MVHPTLEIVYATPESQTRFTIAFVPGITIAEVLQDSRIQGLAYSAVAIYGKKQITDTTVLEPFDRIELLRPLSIDPKMARRLRVQAKN